MRDFARESVRTYDLGTRSGPVYQFKRKFHPVEIRHPEPITVVTNPVLYAAWSAVGLRLLLPRPLPLGSSEFFGAIGRRCSDSTPTRMPQVPTTEDEVNRRSRSIEELGKDARPRDSR